MRVSYNKFFKLLIDKRMKKGDLCKSAGISTNAMSKMGKNLNMTVDVLARICCVLGCKFDDIVEIVTDDNQETGNVDDMPNNGL